MSIDIRGIKPTLLEVKYKNGEPYIYYEGIFSFNGKELKIVIPHLDMSLDSLSVEYFEEVYLGGKGKRIILPSEETRFYCHPTRLCGEEVNFIVKEERNQIKDPFFW